MQLHPILEELDVSVGAMLPQERVEFAGHWLPSTRRTYAAAQQEGSGSKPFVDVIDVRWQGTLSGTEPLAAIAFMTTLDEVFWIKTAPAEAPLSAAIGGSSDGNRFGCGQYWIQGGRWESCNEQEDRHHRIGHRRADARERLREARLRRHDWDEYAS